MCSKTHEERLHPAHHLPRLQPALGQADHLARVHFAHQLGADDVEGAALRGDDEAVAEPAEAERPDPVRVAEGDDRVLGHHHGRVGALEPRHHLLDRVLDRLAVVGRQQRRDDLRVAGPAEVDPALLQLAPQLDRVGQVAVVGERHLAAVVAPDRLRVLPGAAAGGRVAHVADRHVALQRPQLLLVEDLGHQPGVAHRGDVAALAGGDPGRLLAAVLQRVEAEVGEPARHRARGRRRRRPRIRRGGRRGRSGTARTWSRSALSSFGRDDVTRRRIAYPRRVAMAGGGADSG